MKILVADDHPLYRSGLRHILAELAAEVSIEEASDHAEVFELLAAHRDVDLLLLDLAMPGMNGLEALGNLTRKYPSLTIVVLSASENHTDMKHALDAGALGFIPKSTRPIVMINALRLVLAGGLYVPPALIREAAIESGPSTVDDFDLTPRQLAVLTRVAEGKPNKVIAAELQLAEATVKTHITAAFKSLGVTNRTQAAYALQRVQLPHP